MFVFSDGPETMLTTIKNDESLPEREEIEQVRRLLFGDVQEANLRRMEAIENNIQALRQKLEQQITALGAANTASHLSFIRTLGEALMALGQQISQLASTQTQGEMGGNVDTMATYVSPSTPETLGAAPETGGHD